MTSRTYERVPAYGDGLRLHLNENTAGCSPTVLAAMRAVTRQECARYPDYADTISAAARWLGVPADCVALTNGLDEGISAVAYGYLQRAGDGSPRRALIVQPAFDMYAACARQAHAEIVDIAPRPDFSCPVDEILAAVTPSTRVVFLASPNNPTGGLVSLDEVTAIARALPDDAIVFLDEAYVDFADGSALPLLAEIPSLVIGRTFAKAHGLAAVRAGALIAQAATLSRIHRQLPPYGVNVFAMAAIVAAAQDEDYTAWYRRQVVASRQMIYDACEAFGVTAFPSHANFVLIRVHGDVADVVAAMAARGVFVRDRSSQPGCAGCIRLTAGIVEHTSHALAVLTEVLCDGR